MSTQIAEVQGDPRQLTFPPDAVQEMSIMTSSYPAEFGNTGGGVEQFVFKSGTNGFHGSLYEFLRNTDFDARGFYNSSVAVHHENEFGGTFGGPVWIPKLYNGRNKTFFFVNVNEYKLRGGAQNSIGSVPDAEFRNGDLSGLVDASGNQIPIYDPASTAQNAPRRLLAHAVRRKYYSRRARSAACRRPSELRSAGHVAGRLQQLPGLG